MTGIPLLWPWANRIDQTSYYVNGKLYAFNLELGNVRLDANKKPIHGLIGTSSAWKVVSSKADGQAAEVTSRLEYWKYPDLMEQFPFAHTIELTYRLKQGVLQVETVLHNLAAEPMPVAIGFHSFYRVNDAPPDQWKIHLGARDQLVRGILDYVAPRFKGPVVIAEASARDTLEGFANYKYAQVIPEFKAQKVSLVDLNREKKFEIFAIVDRNIRPTPVRLAARLMDPDAFIISSAMLKTHNAVVATGSVKNMVMGAPLHSLPGETPVWSDKHVYHAMPPNHEQIGVTDGHHAMNYSMAITALHMKRHWGVAVIDGFEGMEGNGPTSGDPVPMHIALASPDYLAVDRVAIETMGIPAHAVGYMQYAAQMGLGQFDLSKIDIRGEKPESVKRTFKLNQNANFQLDWLSDLNKTA
jgi:uncharacterized protein (DUF362 family)